MHPNRNCVGYEGSGRGKVVGSPCEVGECEGALVGGYKHGCRSRGRIALGVWMRWDEPVWFGEIRVINCVWSWVRMNEISIGKDR